VVGEKWNPQILVYFPVTDFLRLVSAKILVLQHMQLPDMAVGSGPPDRACIVYHMAEELLIKQHTQATSPVKKDAKHPVLELPFFLPR
jgi:hypothetical protein